MKRGHLRGFGISAAAALVALAGAARAADLTVGTGSTLDLGTGSLDAGCSDFLVGGTLALNAGSASQVRDLSIQPGGTLQGSAGSIEVAGNWSNTGSFSAGTGTVQLADGCGVASSSVNQSNSFYRLFLSSATAKIFNFAAGTTQAVAQRFQAHGTSTDLLQIRSSTAGVAANLDVQGSRGTSYLDVQDNHATGLPVLFGLGSTDSGNTNGWVFGSVPVLSAAGLLLAAGGLAWAARRRLSLRPEIGA